MRDRPAGPVAILMLDEIARQHRSLLARCSLAGELEALRIFHDLLAIREVEEIARHPETPPTRHLQMEKRPGRGEGPGR